MNVKRLFLAGGALALLSSSANAAFIFSTSRTVGATNDRVNFIVNDDSGTLTIGALNGDLTAVGQPNGLKFQIGLGGAPQVYPTGAAQQTVGAFDPGPRLTFGGISSEFGATSVVIPDTGDPVARQAYAQGLPTINYTSFFTTPVSVASSDLGGGLVLASAIVPTGTPVTFSGNIDNDLESANGKTPFSLSNGTDIPEPTSLAFLGLGALGLFGRRRK